MTKLRIFLGDDHAIVREGIKRLIDSSTDLEVVGEAGDGEAVLAGVAALRPDTVVLDITMPRPGGVETTRKLKTTMPEVRVLALTMHETPAYLREILEAGAAGYVVKTAAPDELLPAIRKVAAGQLYVDPRMMTKLVATIAAPKRVAGDVGGGVTEREAEVLRQVARGYTNREIGTSLQISMKSVETYRGRGMKKLGLSNRADIVRYATDRGWLTEAK